MQQTQSTLGQRAAKWLAAGVNAAMVEAIRAYALQLKREGKSRRTVVSYAWELGQLALAWPALGPDDYQGEHISAYMAAREKRLAAASYKLSVIAVRSFFRQRQGPQSPARGLKVPSRLAPVRARRSLTRQQCDDLLASFDTATAKGARDLALTALMLDTAFRVSEVAALEMAGLDFEHRTAEVRCKGGELGKGKFSEATRALLLRWLDWREKIARPGVRAVFAGVQHGRPLTVSGITRLCQQAAQRAGLPALAPHDLRRTFAHEALRSGAPERIAMAGGRWKSHHVFHTHYTRDISVDDVDAYLPTRRVLGF